MKVSFVIVARNAEKYIKLLLDDIEAQNYPKELIELILIDSMSDDNTKTFFYDFKRNSNINTLILDNPGKILACGCNVALSVCTGDAIVRVDAHSRISYNFISKNVEFLLKNHDIIGGIVSTTIPENPWQALISASDNSRFGGGAASFRNPGNERYVDTLAYAMYKKSVYDDVGLYDERLVRTEDNDMHYRMKNAGYKFYFSPEINSIHTARQSFSTLFKQKWGNGKWIGITLGVQPRCFGLRHFIPMIFVLALILCFLSTFIFNWFLLGLLLIMYFTCAIAFSIKEIISLKGIAKLYGALLPFVFFIMHLIYGFGTIFGLLMMRKYLSKVKC